MAATRPRSPRARRAPRAAYHHGELREALIAEALAAVAADGSAALNLRDLARRLGVSPAAPYRHFVDKDELLRAVAAEVGARYAAEMTQAASEAPPDALSQFRATGVAAVRFAVRHPAHYRVMHDPALGGGHDPDEPALIERLAAAQAAGEIAPLPLDAIVLTARAAIYGLTRMISDGQLPDGPPTVAEADAMAMAVTEVLGYGLWPRPAAPPAATRRELPPSRRRAR